MKRLFFAFMAAALMCGCQKSPLEQSLSVALDVAAQKYSAQAETLEGNWGNNPYSYVDGEVAMAGQGTTWGCGYFAGNLWQLAQWHKDEELADYAYLFTRQLDKITEFDNLHDMAIMVTVAHMNAFKATGKEHYEVAIDQIARLMSSHFYNTFSTIDHKPMDPSSMHCVTAESFIPLIPYKKYGWGDMVNYHAQKSIENHFREDGAAYEGVEYDRISSNKVKVFALRAQSAESALARAQAWMLYGYTQLYKEFEDKQYLSQAERLAAYIIKNLPQDAIPNWDFDSEHQQKDSSAAAIMASAFLDMYAVTENETYLKVAEQQLTTLSNEEYMAKEGECGCFLLKHGVDNYPSKQYVDAPLIYGDYYFIEAAVKYLSR